MKIKPFIIVVSIAAGLLISALSAFMTFWIIGEPIGMKMLTKIVLTIVLMLPIIGLISYLFGRYLASKFNFIQNRLDKIKHEDFREEQSRGMIDELNGINIHMNFLAQHLENLILDLKQKNRNLSDLLTSMAHDIKTPITVLNGYIDEIDDGLITAEELPHVLKHMKDEVNFLDELTVDMLAYITSMQNHKVKTEINLHDLIEQELFPLLSKSKDISYLNNVDKDFHIAFNKIDLKKILMNLLSNAQKYTESGSIKVSINGNEVFIENSGEAIDEQYREQIFEPFFTISKSKNRKKSGFGLGLSIVRNLSRNNGYDCYLKSSNKEKTVFALAKSTSI